MKIIRITLVIISCAFLVSCSKKPDIIYINGKIYTMDKNNSIVEAIAVRDGKILAIGKTQELTEKYSSIKTIDLKGKTVVPGFIDAEGNLMEFSRNLSFIDLRNAKSLKEIVKLVKEKVSKTQEGEWIGGFGWDDLALPPAEFKRIDHRVLDSISTSHKIYLINSRADIVWVNKATLEAAYIKKETPDPKNGEIEKDKNNEPTGLLYDDAQLLVIQALPTPKEDQVIENVQKGISELFKYGITEVNDANLSEDNLNLYKKMVDQNKFPIRLYAMISGKGPLFDKYISSGPENYKDKINIKCMYLEYDGYFETHDAAMFNDYNKEPRRKTAYNDEYDIREMMKKAFQKDFQVSIKTVGDRAVTSTLNAIDSAYKQGKPKAGRNRIEYIEFVQPQDIQRIKQFEIIPSIRPEVTLEDKVVATDLINPDNSKNLGLWSTLLKQNGMIISGTDFPYHQINPLIQIYYLATGMSLDTTLNKLYNNSAQKFTVSDALKSFTVWPAYACFEEDIKGSLEPEKLADFVVLSDDILALDPRVLLNTKILMTVVRGEVVYEYKLSTVEISGEPTEWKP
jgi:predicted amidohydrolase YtcJ